MWFEDAVFYQVYPLGLCGAPEYNTWSEDTWNGAAEPENRIQKMYGWIGHLQQLGISAVYFSPVFQSDKHGYDTRDYYTIDSRLGSNDDFAEVCNALHNAGIRVVLDGVFNHTGRGFWAFRDVQQNRQNSPYASWYHINWNGNSPFNDGFAYEGWEGCYDLVKLNLQNPQVKEHIFKAIEKWIRLFKIDGIRLDVAYSLDRNFLRELRAFCNRYEAGNGGAIVLIAETIHSNDFSLLQPDMVHSCTNYEVYKSLYSSINSRNMFEISYSLNRLFAAGGIVENSYLFTFLDNHDVSRIASLIGNKANLPLLYGLLFGVPGVPCIYYGSEWELQGTKADGDSSLRPCIHEPKQSPLSDFIGRLSKLRQKEPALRYGSFCNVYTASEQYFFVRSHHDPFTGKNSQILIGVNSADTTAYIADNCVTIPSGSYQSEWTNLFTNEQFSIRQGTITLLPHSIMYAKREGQ